MLGEGLEPTRITVPPDPKSGASTNSATRAKATGKPNLLGIIEPVADPLAFTFPRQTKFFMQNLSQRRMYFTKS